MLLFYRIKSIVDGYWKFESSLLRSIVQYVHWFFCSLFRSLDLAKTPASITKAQSTRTPCW